MLIISFLIALLVYIAFSIYFLLNPVDPIYHLLLPSSLFLIAHLVGASVSTFRVGLLSLRGKLFFGMASGYVFFAIGVFVYLFFRSELIFYISFYIATLFMIAYVLYEAFEYTKRGLTLDLSDIMQIITISAFLTVLIIIIVLYTYSFDKRIYFNAILILLGFLLIIFILPAVLMHWGGIMGFEWLAIAIGSFILLVSNILFTAYLSNSNVIFLKIASYGWGIVGLGGIAAFVFGEVGR